MSQLLLRAAALAQPLPGFFLLRAPRRRGYLLPAGGGEQAQGGWRGGGPGAGAAGKWHAQLEGVPLPHVGPEQLHGGGGAPAGVRDPRCVGDEGHVLHGQGPDFAPGGVPQEAPGRVHARRAPAGHQLHVGRRRLQRPLARGEARVVPDEDWVREGGHQRLLQQDCADGRDPQPGPDADAVRGAVAAPPRPAQECGEPRARRLHWDTHPERADGGQAAAGHHQGRGRARGGRGLPVLVPDAPAAALPCVPAQRPARRCSHGVPQKAAVHEGGDTRRDAEDLRPEAAASAATPAPSGLLQRQHLPRHVPRRQERQQDQGPDLSGGTRSEVPGHRAGGRVLPAEGRHHDRAIVWARGDAGAHAVHRRKGGPAVRGRHNGRAPAVQPRLEPARGGLPGARGRRRPVLRGGELPLREADVPVRRAHHAEHVHTAVRTRHPHVRAPRPARGGARRDDQAVRGDLPQVAARFLARLLGPAGAEKTHQRQGGGEARQDTHRPPQPRWHQNARRPQGAHRQARREEVAGHERRRRGGVGGEARGEGCPHL
mmetsp:Transcript_131239/g.356319  ORF Transcript_131239/g.356319 Transcript_131239/m.356319 type:complete len:542 (+) Transcript_131239:968-2593(+)